jgi:hypothetical protein
MLVLSGLGLMHARRTSPATEILSGPPARANGLQPSNADLAAAPGTAGTRPA